MTDVAPQPEKHTLTSALEDAKEKEQSGNYYVGSFFEDDSQTPSQEVRVGITYNFGTAWVASPPESEAEIVLEIGDTADTGNPDLLELGKIYRGAEMSYWSGFVEELRARGVTIDELWVENEHPMQQGTLYVAVPSRKEEEKAVSVAYNLVKELDANGVIANI